MEELINSVIFGEDLQNGEVVHQIDVELLLILRLEEFVDDVLMVSPGEVLEMSHHQVEEIGV